MCLVYVPYCIEAIWNIWVILYSVWSSGTLYARVLWGVPDAFWWWISILFNSTFALSWFFNVYIFNLKLKVRNTKNWLFKQSQGSIVMHIRNCSSAAEIWSVHKMSEDRKPKKKNLPKSDWHVSCHLTVIHRNPYRNVKVKHRQQLRTIYFALREIVILNAEI